ncbi:MAG TPA: hypothetical protein VLA88_04050 [Candidatus Saccharimonadales bacterium]|nr:hypothetical protein [Candidatus Saccharimonadales bacterium]
MHTPIYRKDDNELLGYIAKHNGQWRALTIFGYPFACVHSESEARTILAQKGLSVLTGVWQFQTPEGDWEYCVIKEARPGEAVIIPTNVMGYPDPGTSKTISITDPTALRPRAD